MSRLFIFCIVLGQRAAKLPMSPMSPLWLMWIRVRAQACHHLCNAQMAPPIHPLGAIEDLRDC